MEEKSTQEDDDTGSTVSNFKILNGGRSNCAKLLEYFDEETERCDARWIESVRKDTRVLLRWRKEVINECQNVKGKAFVHCPLFHPHDDLPLGKQSRNGDFGNQSTLLLETALSRISKARRGKLQFSVENTDRKDSPNILNASAGGEQDEALAAYCRQHAYSRDLQIQIGSPCSEPKFFPGNRKNNNNLFEKGEVSDSCEKQSLEKTYFIKLSISWTKIHRLDRAVKNTYADTSHENLDRGDSSHSQNNLPLQKGLKIKNYGSNQMRESDESEHRMKTTWKKPHASEMQESLTVNPCIFFRNQVLSEPRSRH